MKKTEIVIQDQKKKKINFAFAFFKSSLNRLMLAVCNQEFLIILIQLLQ